MAGAGAVGVHPGRVMPDAPVALLAAGRPAAVSPADAPDSAHTSVAAGAPEAIDGAVIDGAVIDAEVAAAEVAAAEVAAAEVAAAEVAAAGIRAGGINAEVGGADVVEVLRARWRQVSRAYAAYLEAVVEVDQAAPLSGSHPSGPDGVSRAWEGWEWSAAEIAAALTFTGRRADSELAFARMLMGRLPLVLAALRAGQLDQHKARVFADHLSDLSAGQIERICGRLVPRAAGWTTGQLAARLLREVHAVDAGHVRRRYQRAVRERGVSGVLAPDGTATITAHGLAPAEAAAAAERLEQLAEAVHRSGHPGTVHQIRADLFVRLLDGRYDGLTSAVMITAMLAEAAGDDRVAGSGGIPETRPNPCRPHGDAGDPGGTTAGSRARSHREHGGRGSGGSFPLGQAEARNPGGGGGGGSSDPDPGSLAPSHAESSRAELDGAGAGGAGVGGAGAGGAADSGSDSSSGTGRDRCSSPDTRGGDGRAGQQGPVERAGDRRPASAVGRRHGVEVRIGLTTLLGLDEHPAELPGWGPIVACDARLLVARQHRAEWRIAVTDAEGHLLHGTTTRRRPRTPPPSGRTGAARSSPPPARGGIVEIHVPATVLRRLTGGAGGPGSSLDAAGAWAGVVADIARSYRGHDEGVGLDARPRARFAGAALRRHVQMRDRTCVAPGCRRPASKAEQDHTRDHHRGGDTVRVNLAPLCRRHHAMKHQAGWSLEQPGPGVFCWRSPLGQLYRTRGEPVGPDLPDALPRDPTDGVADDPLGSCTVRMSDGPILSRPLDAEPARPPPRPVDLDDLPPF